MAHEQLLIALKSLVFLEILHGTSITHPAEPNHKPKHMGESLV